MSLFSEGGFTQPDFLFTFILGVCLGVSTILNPAVFLYHCSKPNSIPKVLFQVLAIVDFLTCLCFPINGVTIISPRGESRCYYNDTIFHCEEKALVNTTMSTVVALKFQGFFHLILAMTPSLLSSILAIFRYLQLKKPFRRFRIRQAVMVVGVNMVYLTTTTATVFFHAHTRYYYSLLTTWNPYFFKDHLAADLNTTVYDSKAMLFIAFPILSCQGVSIVASILTVWDLRKSAKTVSLPQDVTNKKQTYKVIVINTLGLLSMFIPSFCTLYVNIRNNGGVNEDSSVFDNYVVFLSSNVVPVLISVLNPVMFIVMTPGIHKAFIRTSAVVMSSITGNNRVLPFVYST